MNDRLPKAKRPENRRMQDFLALNGIQAVPKRLFDGSLKGTWRLYNPAIRWSVELANRLNALGFTNFNGAPLDELDGNGGTFSVYVRGHDELLTNPEAQSNGSRWAYRRHACGMVEVFEDDGHHHVITFWRAPKWSTARADTHEDYAKQIVEDHNTRL